MELSDIVERIRNRPERHQAHTHYTAHRTDESHYDLAEFWGIATHIMARHGWKDTGEGDRNTTIYTKNNQSIKIGWGRTARGWKFGQIGHEFGKG